MDITKLRRDAVGQIINLNQSDLAVIFDMDSLASEKMRSLKFLMEMSYLEGAINALDRAKTGFSAPDAPEPSSAKAGA